MEKDLKQDVQSLQFSSENVSTNPQFFTAPWGRGRRMGRGKGGGTGEWGHEMGFDFQAPQQPLKLPRKFKVAISSQTSGGLNDIVSPSFARCSTFTIADVENEKISGVKIIENKYLNQSGGVGIAVAQMLGGMGVRAAIAGSFGPNSYVVLNQFNISTFNVPLNTKVGDAINMLIRGKQSF